MKMALSIVGREIFRRELFHFHLMNTNIISYTKLRVYPLLRKFEIVFVKLIYPIYIYLPGDNVSRSSNVSSLNDILSSILTPKYFILSTFSINLIIK